MNVMKRIALVAHDERKQDLLEWVRFNSSACNRVTADYLISSQLFDEDFQPVNKEKRRYIRGRAISPL